MNMAREECEIGKIVARVINKNLRIFFCHFGVIGCFIDPYDLSNSTVIQQLTAN